MSGQVGIAILAKAPVPGQAKTRLIPALGAEGAARLQAWLLERTVTLGLDAGIGPVTLWWEGALDHPALAVCRTLGSIECRRQPKGGLGSRMLKAIKDSPTPAGTLVIGTDCPALDCALLREAAQSLQHQDAVVVPAADGGYVLIGMRHAAAGPFAKIRWGTSEVMATTRQRLKATNLRWTEPATLWDIDRPSDLSRLIAICPDVGALPAGDGITIADCLERQT